MGAVTLDRYLEQSADPVGHASRLGVDAIVASIAAVCIAIADVLSLGALAALPDEGDASVLMAHRMIVEALRGRRVREFFSAANGKSTILDEAGEFALAVSPLAGAGDIAWNLPAGTIFAVADASDAKRKILAAGFVVYGAHTAFVLTRGAGVDIFTLDPRDRAWRLTSVEARLPDGAQDHENPGERRQAPAARTSMDERLVDAGEAQGVGARWGGSLAAQAFRILLRGGVLLDPPEGPLAHDRGLARFLCEARPIAFVIEQAGGRASNGLGRILDQTPGALGPGAPFIIGSRRAVERIERLYVRPDGAADVSPLFGKRGLFRA